VLTVRPVVCPRVTTEEKRLRSLHGIPRTLDHVGCIRAGTINSITGTSRRKDCQQESKTDEAAAAKAQRAEAHGFVSSHRAVFRAKDCLRRSAQSPGWVEESSLNTMEEGFCGLHRFYLWLSILRLLVSIGLLPV
jgi:hypothetical protein